MNIKSVFKRFIFGEDEPKTQECRQKGMVHYITLDGRAEYSSIIETESDFKRFKDFVNNEDKIFEEANTNE